MKRRNPSKHPLYGALAGAVFGAVWPYVSTRVVPEGGSLPQKALLRAGGQIAGSAALGAYFGGPAGGVLGVGAGMVTAATVGQFRAGNRDPLGGVKALGAGVATLTGAPVRTVATLPPAGIGGGMELVAAPAAPVAAAPPEVAYGRRKWPKVESHV